MVFVGSIHGGQTLSLAKIFSTHNLPVHHRHRRRPTPPIFISTNLSDVNPIHLRDLCNTCNHSFHRFPNILPDGRLEPIAVDKLRIALSHSSVVVSVFAGLEWTAGDDWYRRMIPVTPVTGQLVGFGRAVSDEALTASIYDVMVIPTLQGRGIGRMILQSIIRLLTNKGIYDIAALCSDQEMNFFKACGFGDDILESTTMMYTRSGNDAVQLELKNTSSKMLLCVANQPRRSSPCYCVETEEKKDKPEIISPNQTCVERLSGKKVCEPVNITTPMWFKGDLCRLWSNGTCVVQQGEEPAWCDNPCGKVKKRS
ncbi:hypothetical protein R6Q57_021392 [Mikania cordata]